MRRKLNLLTVKPSNPKKCALEVLWGLSEWIPGLLPHLQELRKGGGGQNSGYKMEDIMLGRV